LFGKKLAVYRRLLNGSQDALVKVPMRRRENKRVGPDGTDGTDGTGRDGMDISRLSFIFAKKLIY
jgi:hypothetical protein